MAIAISVFFLFLTSLTYADCVCTPLSSACADGYSNTCGSSSPCDSIQISTSNYELTQECINSNTKVPYLEMYAGYFTLQDNFFKKSGGIHIKKTSDMYWYGFNNFEQINKVTYVDSLKIVHESPLNMNTGYFGDAIFEFGENTKGSQFLQFDTATTTLRDESILNISTAYLWNPKEVRLYNNSKLISAVIGKGCCKSFYFHESSSLILDESHYRIYMPFIHYFYDDSILQFERNTKSYLKQVYFYDTSLLNISESSFIRFDSFSLSLPASVETGEDSLLSPLSLNVIETIIGYPIISLWNENSMLNNIYEIDYNGNECIEVYSFASSNAGLTLPSNYIQLANNQLIRYCLSSVDYDVYCYFIDDNNYPLFISPRCMNSYYSNYLCHSIQNTFEVGNDQVNITLAEINTNHNTKSSTSKSESIEPNTFISIETSKSTINTVNAEIQLDLILLISSSSSTYILNSSIIEIIEDSIITLDYSTHYIQFINLNNYQFNVDFTQDEIVLYSENVFDINDGNICYFVLFRGNSFICLTDKLEKSCDEGYYESNNYTVCSECSMSNCRRCITTKCYLCSDNYYLENENCIKKKRNM
ncbi:hypothetical protein QTN25_008686 [Entamoeba marina]